MTQHTHIRALAQDEVADLLALYPLVFPDEDLTGLLSQLLNGSYHVTSLGAFRDAALVGHILFTPDLSGKGALLGPLAVHPDAQGAGLGTALIDAGLEAMKAQGIAQVFVLGDPEFYGRSGFTTEHIVQPCYPLPEQWRAVWQSLLLAQRAELPAAPLVLPEPWMSPALWS